MGVQFCLGLIALCSALCFVQLAESQNVVQRPVKHFTLENHLGENLKHHLFKYDNHIHLGRALRETEAVDLEMKVNDDFISCRNLVSIGSLCPVSSKVKVTEYKTREKAEYEKDYSCISLATRDYSCTAAITKEGLKVTSKMPHSKLKTFQLQVCRNETSEMCITDVDSDNIFKNSSIYYDDDMIFAQDENETKETNSNSLTDQAFASVNNEEKSKSNEINFLGLWDGCYEGIESLHTLNIGVSISSRMFENHYQNSVDDAIQAVELLLSDINFAYIQQFHIKLTLKHVEIVHSNAASKPSWNLAHNKCPATVQDQLTLFQEEASPSTQAIWHLLDDCYSNQGAIGVAYVGAICTSSPKGVSWFSSSRFFKTIAHEIGHNFGALHSFERGQGTTGGIMDYGDGTIDFDLQFNRKFRYNDVCTRLQNRLESCKEQGVLVNEDVSECGNGVVEPGEQCECEAGETSCSCCKNCILRGNSECDGIHNECCRSNCTFFSAEQSCEVSIGTGYCRAGFCQTTLCRENGYVDFCGIDSDNPCVTKCVDRRNEDVCIDVADDFAHVRDGGLCSDETVPFGQCSSGTCVKRTIGLEIPGQTGIRAALLFPIVAITLAFAYVGFGHLSVRMSQEPSEKPQEIIAPASFTSEKSNVPKSSSFNPTFSSAQYSGSRKMFREKSAPTTTNSKSNFQKSFNWRRNASDHVVYNSNSRSSPSISKFLPGPTPAPIPSFMSATYPSSSNNRNNKSNLNDFPRYPPGLPPKVPSRNLQPDNDTPSWKKALLQKKKKKSEHKVPSSRRTAEVKKQISQNQAGKKNFKDLVSKFEAGG